MSCFIIDKIEYVKAAGLLYGVEEQDRDLEHSHYLAHIRENFMDAYKKNVQSVNERYNEKTQPEKEEYDETFEVYRVLGHEVGTNTNATMNKEQFRWNLLHFFGSVLYQIENQQLHMEVSAYFYKVMAILFCDEIHRTEGWWGEVSVDANA